MEKNWLANPTKKQTIVFGSMGIFGITGLLLSITNFLTENPFNKKYMAFFFLLIPTIITTIQIIDNYLKQNK